MEQQSLFKIVEEISIDLQSVIPAELIIQLKEYIADKCDSIRETIIRQEFERKRYLDDAFYQVVDCNELECLQKTCTINGVSVVSDTDIYVVNISPLVTGLHWQELKFVSTQAMNTVFMRRSFASFINYKTQYTKGGPIYTIVGNDMYLKNLPTSGMKFISYAGILSKPSTACNWKETSYYPVPSPYKLKILVKQDILSTYAPRTPKPQKDEQENDNQEAAQR